MQRLGRVGQGGEGGGATPSASAMKACEDLYKPDASNAKALAALFNDDIGNESCRQRRKRKLVS